MRDAGLGWALDQDCAVLGELQRGVQSAGFRFARLSEQEARIRHFWSEYARYVSLDGLLGVSPPAGA
jgi:hypothetical protein